MKGSVDYHKRVDFRALDVFVHAVKSATRDELKGAVKTASEMSNDLAINSNERPIWKRLATLLRAELKGYAKNPARRKNPVNEKGFIIESKSPRSCAEIHKQIKGFAKYGRPEQVYECGKCHKQFVTPTSKKNPRKKNPAVKNKFLLYDVLNDYSQEIVPGSPAFETMNAAKKLAIKNNEGRAVTWSIAKIPQGPQKLKRYFGHNSYDELIYMLVVVPQNLTRKNSTRKKNPVGPGPFIIFAYNYKWKADTLRYAFNNKGKFGLTSTKSKAMTFKTSGEAMRQAERMGKQYSTATAIGVTHKNGTQKDILKFLGAPPGKQ